MDKTFTINIAGTVFTIEQTAYTRLQEYLDSIKQYFASYPDHDEIIADIKRIVKIPDHQQARQQLMQLLEEKGKYMSAGLRLEGEFDWSSGLPEDLAAFVG